MVSPARYPVACTTRGYCTFNGLVLAAHRALLVGAKSVLILDLDAHCGGGTASLIEGLAGVRQVDVSVSRFDGYEGKTNSTLELVDMAEAYLPTIEHCLNRVVLQPPDLVIYNAGMDPFEGCSTGGLAGINEEMLREREPLPWQAGMRGRACPRKGWLTYID